MKPNFDTAQFEDDVARRRAWQPGEHPLLTRLVVLRVALNHEFGMRFRLFDHELAQIEAALAKELKDG
jgi:hypothetical protein